MNTELLKKILVYIDEHIYEKISLVELAEVAGYSPFYFSKLFAETMGMPVNYLVQHPVQLENILFLTGCLSGLCRR